MDLEMTGLDPARNVIVEIATLVTDDQLELVAEGPDLVIHQPAEALDAMEDVVREMHTRSGLLPAIQASTVSLADAGAATLEFIRTHVPAPRKETAHRALDDIRESVSELRFYRDHLFRLGADGTAADSGATVDAAEQSGLV